MASCDLKPKIDVVLVEKKTRGKFPGKKAPAETLGLVWSKWTSNPQWGTEKISILTAESNIYFTTAKCVSRVGTIIDWPDFLEAYKNYAELDFVPVFGFVKSLEKEKEFLTVRFLSNSHFVTVPSSCVHFEDLDEILNCESEEKFFCLRIEPWFLKRAGLI